MTEELGILVSGFQFEFMKTIYGKNVIPNFQTNTKKNRFSLSQSKFNFDQTLIRYLSLAALV